MAKTPITYWKAQEVRDIAEGLIPEFHEHLQEKTILYVFRSQASEKKFRVVLGSARQVSGLNAYLAFREVLEVQDISNCIRSPVLKGDARPPAPPVPTFYVIDIAYDTWLKLTGSQRIALVDHELSHIGADGMVGHDIEEFSSVVARHGEWKPDLKEFARALRETPLFESVEALRPKPGSGIDSITFSSPGGESVTLTREDVH
jgi:hypothetical protein